MSLRDNVYLYVSIFLLLLVGALSWYVYNLRWENQTLELKLSNINSRINSPVTTQDLYFRPLQDSTINKIDLPYLGSKKEFKLNDSDNNKSNLLIFFTPNDCPYCFTETDFWEQISAVFKDRLDVIGVISDCEKVSCNRFIKKEQITIPVIYDKSKSIFNKLSLNGNDVPRPVKVFINKNGKILHRSTSTYNNDIKQIRYTKTLQYLIAQS